MVTNEEIDFNTILQAQPHRIVLSPDLDCPIFTGHHPLKYFVGLSLGTESRCVKRRGMEAREIRSGIDASGVGAAGENARAPYTHATAGARG